MRGKLLNFFVLFIFRIFFLVWLLIFRSYITNVIEIYILSYLWHMWVAGFIFSMKNKFIRYFNNNICSLGVKFPKPIYLYSYMIAEIKFTFYHIVFCISLLWKTFSVTVMAYKLIFLAWFQCSFFFQNTNLFSSLT